MTLLDKAPAPTFSDINSGTYKLQPVWNKTTGSTYRVDCWATEPVTISSVMGYTGNDSHASYEFYLDQSYEGDLISLCVTITYHGKDGREWPQCWALAEWGDMDKGRLIQVVDQYMRFAWECICNDHGSLVALPNVEVID